MTKYSQSLKPKRSSHLHRRLAKLTKPVFLVMVGLLFVGSIVVYLVEVNYIAAKGFQVRDIEKQIIALQESNEKLQLQAIEMRSMTDLSEKVSQLNMVPIDCITYYDSAGQLVAQR